MTQKQIDLVLSGSGTLIPCHLGALDALLENGYIIKRVAGTSGGSVVASGLAMDWTTDMMMELCKKFLGGGLLDPNLLPFMGWGLFKGDKIHRLLKKHMPDTMSCAHIPLAIFAVDVETQKVVMINRDKGNVPIADAIRASISIPFFFKAAKVKNLPGTFIDGGVGANFAMGVWDDIPARQTIGIRFKSESRRRQVNSTISYTSAVVGMLIDNANKTYVSSKRYSSVIDIESSGDSLDFSLSNDEIQRRYREGHEAATAWIGKQ